MMVPFRPPAYSGYWPIGNGSPFWRGLSSRLPCIDMFAFTYEKCDGQRSARLCIRYNGVFWRRTTWTEIGIRVIVS